MVYGLYVIYYGVCFVCGTMVTTVHVHTCVLLSHLCTTVNYCTHLCTTVHSTVHSCVYTNLYTVQVSERRCSTLVVSTRVGAAWSPRLLFAVARRIGGDGYASWLRTLYTGHERLIVVGGVVSPPVKLLSSVPQGCCHACQAFLIFIEGLAHRIRATPGIDGLGYW